MNVSRIMGTVFFAFCFGVCSNVQAESGYVPSGEAAKEDVFIFAPHPYSNPQDIFEHYEPIMRYLEQKLPGMHFQVEASKNYAEYEEKLVAQRFHFSLPNPYQTVIGMENGYRVIAKMKPDNDFRGLIVARKDQKLRKPRDLVGKSVCFPSPTAVAATMLPLLYLQSNGVNVKQDLQIHYVGSQFSSMLNAYTGESAACGTSVRFWRTWSRDNPDKAKQMVVLWKTTSLPHNSFIARNDVDPKLAQRVASVLAGMDNDKGLDQKQFKVDQQHFEIASNKTYQPMVDFLKNYDRVIGLPQSMKVQKSIP